MPRVPLNSEDDDDRDDISDDADAVEEAPKKPARKGPPKRKSLEPPAKKPRRWKRWFLLMLLVGGGVACAPMIIAATPARNYLLKVALPRFPGTMTIEHAQLAWWRPPVLEGILVTGADGEDLLRIDRIAGNRSPWEIAREPSRLGTLRIEKPVVMLSTRPGSSNLEEALAPLSSGSNRRSSNSAPFEFRVELVDGRIEIVSDDASERGIIDAITVTVESSSDVETGMTVRADADVPSDSGGTGRLQVDATYASAKRGDQPTAEIGAPRDAFNAPVKMASKGEAPILRGTVRVDNVRLESLKPLWKRIEKTMDVGGVLTADLRFRGAPSPSAETLRIGLGGTADVDQFRLQADAWLKGDHVRLSRVQWTGAIESDGPVIVADRMAVSADPGRIEANGTFPIPQLTDLGSWHQLGKSLTSENYTLKADADLAQLAALVPNALRLRDDVEITAGTAQLSLRSLEENGERVMAAELQTTDLAGRTPQGPFVWRDPLQGALAARMGNEGPIIDRLACRASFLEASGQGTLRNARILAKCDLNRFTADAGRILDLREFQLGGRVTVDADCRQDDENRVTAKGRIFFDDFVWAAPGRDALREKQLEVEFNAAAALRDSTLTKLQTAALKVTGGTDELTVDLVRPVMLDEVQDRKGDVPFRVSMNGPLSLWHQRLMPWVGLEQWRFEGDADVASNIVWTPAETRVSGLQGTVRNLQAIGPDLQLREPWIQFTGDASWNAVDQRMTSQELVVNGSSLSLQAEEFALTLPGAAPASLVGTVSFRGDLDRLLDVRASAGARSPQPTTRLRGLATGRIRATQSGDVSTANGEIRIENCVLVRPAAVEPTRGVGYATARATPERQFEEVPLGEVSLIGLGELHQREDSLELKSLKIDSNALQLDVRGSISKLSTAAWADISGTADYDWKALQGWITQLAGDGVKLNGRQSDAFAYRGPLTSGEATTTTRIPTTNVSLGPRSTPSGSGERSTAWSLATGQARTGWESAEIYGLAAGRAQATVRLAEGVARLEGLDVTLAGGRVSAAPFIVLNEGPATLQHAKGRVVDNVQFTPEMCRQWVKYVAPMLADATEIDGRFSLDLNGARVPIAEPKTGDVGGILAVPQAQVRPGPFANQVLTSARQIEVLLKRRSADRVNKSSETFLTLSNQNIEFRMVDGRVHHRGLEFLIGEDVLVRTHGSVGFDDTVDIVAEIPVREEWARKDKFLASLQGQSLQIPIRGTLSRPQVDPRVFEDLTKKLATGSITKGIEDELSNQLDRLFRRGK